MDFYKSFYTYILNVIARDRALLLTMEGEDPEDMEAVRHRIEHNIAEAVEVGETDRQSVLSETDELLSRILVAG